MNGNYKRYFGLFLSFILCVFSFFGCSGEINESGADVLNTSVSLSADGELKVHYIDVGQADSILIQSPNGKNMLIDAGETKKNAVLDYLNGLGVKKLDVIVATHPHSDHISEMASVIKNFETGVFYMPKVQHTTKTFENMIDALSEKNVTVKEALAGVVIDFDKDLNCRIVAPNGSSYDDLNNWSAVVHISYGNTAFIFTGDAEDISENEIVSGGADIKADVLKVGHHGSSSSTSRAFLEKVNPEYAVISAGKDNDYGHPHKETINILNEFGVKIYQTFEIGTIVAVSDGNKISFDNNAVSKNAGEKNDEENVSEKKNGGKNASYIGNVNSKKFHLPTCSALPAEKNRILFETKQEALDNGYVSCGNCNP